MQALPNTGGGPLGYPPPAPPPQPLLTLEEIDAAAADFDYSAFLQDDDGDSQHLDSGYLAEESSGSTTTPPSVSAAQAERALQLLAPRGQAVAAVGGLGGQPGQLGQLGQVGGRGKGGEAGQKQRLERRGHTKSRRGCFNCKRRRIKVSVFWRGEEGGG